MVGVLKEFEGDAWAEAFAERCEKLQVGEVVAGALQEEHWDLDVEKMLCAIVGWVTGRVQREAEEYQSAHSRQGRCGLGL